MEAAFLEQGTSIDKVRFFLPSSLSRQIIHYRRLGGLYGAEHNDLSHVAKRKLETFVGAAHGLGFFSQYVELARSMELRTAFVERCRLRDG